MCGKFTAMASWRQVHAFSQPLTVPAGDEIVTYRVMGAVPVIVFDRESGARKVVPMRTFNEGKDIPGGKTEQWTIDPLDGAPRGLAFVWRRFHIVGLPAPMFACVMVTVPASRLIEPITDRMPAILAAEDWATWLGEDGGSPAEAKAALKTMDGASWQMAREPKPAKMRGK